MFLFFVFHDHIYKKFCHEGTVYVQGLNFSIFIFFHKNKVFTVTFQTKNIFQKEQIFAGKLGKGVWVRCLFI